MGRGDFKVKLKLELRDNKLLVYVSLHYRVCYIHLMTNASSVAGITALREPSVFQFCQQWDSSVYITDWFTYAQWSRTAASPNTRTEETKAAVAPESSS